MKKAAVYTRTGDKGTTGLYTGERVPKQSLRVEAYGTVDEISSALGLARAQVTREDVRETIFNVQKLLMSVMLTLPASTCPNLTSKKNTLSCLKIQSTSLILCCSRWAISLSPAIL